MSGKSALAGVAVGLGLAFGSAGGAASGVPGCGPVARAPRTATAHQLRTSVLCLINRARERHGVPQLGFNAALRRSATAHSKSMVRSGTFSHYGPDGSTPVTRISRSGYLTGATSYQVAEDIGAGKGRRDGSPLAIVRKWIRSPSHRGNILDRALRDFGVGVARGDPLGGGGGNAVTYTLDLGARWG